ncbi:hypothetical protein RFI_13735 [Reticulomyxa filosa]|uniref:Uncharacterized protein n=1 Tax=Reticulomyxa filosa TaxID=46433 RepID=X6NBT4_RETFI|nr:hypothetical protein RFI_13735 [Reticulomyxa filosa]|eukprot:ETO23451.1 hypothetical protein RFI_13735 [Reticulomyxa filosa]
MEQKIKFYQTEKEDGVTFEWLSTLVISFQNEEFIQRELDYWQKINLTNDMDTPASEHKSNSKFGKVEPNGRVLLKYNHSGISRVVLSQDGKFIVVATVTGEIVMWYIPCQRLHAYTPKKFKSDTSVTQLQMAPNNKQILTLDCKSIIRLYMVQKITTKIGKKNSDDFIQGGYWQSTNTIPVQDIVPYFQLSPPDLMRPALLRTKSVQPTQKEIDSYLPVVVAFHSCVSISGIRPSILIGLSGGIIVKWNTDDTMPNNNEILCGHCMAPDEPYFPMYSVESTPNENHLYITREYFQAHASSIVLVCNYQNSSNVLMSIDEEGLIAIWEYHDKSWTDYGWFQPMHRLRLDLDDFLYLEQKKVECAQFLPKSEEERAREYYEKLDLSKYQFWKSTKLPTNNTIEKLYLPVEETKLDILTASEYEEGITIQALTFDCSNGRLLQHCTQQHVRIKHFGRLHGAKMCYNGQDIVLANILESVSQDTINRTLQFRLIKTTFSVTVNSFNVSINISSNDSTLSEIQFEVSPVLYPPGSDYLYVLQKQKLSVYSLLTGSLLTTSIIWESVPDVSTFGLDYFHKRLVGASSRANTPLELVNIMITTQDITNTKFVLYLNKLANVNCSEHTLYSLKMCWAVIYRNESNGLHCNIESMILERLGLVVF